MRYKQGDKVKITLEAFHKAFGKDEVWVIDHIKTQAHKGTASLYVCYRENDKNKMLYQFHENEVTQ